MNLNPFLDCGNQRNHYFMIKVPGLFNFKAFFPLFYVSLITFCINTTNSGVSCSLASRRFNPAPKQILIPPGGKEKKASLITVNKQMIK